MVSPATIGPTWFAISCGSPLNTALICSSGSPADFIALSGPDLNAFSFCESVATPAKKDFKFCEDMVNSFFERLGQEYTIPPRKVSYATI